jgi:hypothetical protein
MQDLNPYPHERLAPPHQGETGKTDSKQGKRCRFGQGSVGKHFGILTRCQILAEGRPAGQGYRIQAGDRGSIE